MIHYGLVLVVLHRVQRQAQIRSTLIQVVPVCACKEGTMLNVIFLTEQ